MRWFFSCSSVRAASADVKKQLTKCNRCAAWPRQFCSKTANETRTTRGSCLSSIKRRNIERRKRAKKEKLNARIRAYGGGVTEVDVLSGMATTTTTRHGNFTNTARYTDTAGYTGTAATCTRRTRTATCVVF